MSPRATVAFDGHNQTWTGDVNASKDKKYGHGWGECSSS